jgi:hypothetical protein
VFAIHDCGFIVRCTLEAKDSAQVRYKKICDLIDSCQYGIHDISRTELDSKNHLPRFNMPLELGLFLGTKEFGGQRGQSKVCLVLDKQPYRYQKFCSDLAGVDIEAHKNRPKLAISVVRDWLQTNRGKNIQESIPDGQTISERYHLFLHDLPKLRKTMHLNRGGLIFPDYLSLVEGWIRANDWRPH